MLFMISHLEVTMAAVPMGSLLFRDGTQLQASVPLLSQDSLLDGCYYLEELRKGVPSVIRLFHLN